MQALLNIGVIGLGVMGQRMLERLQGHERLRVVAVWDANPAAIAKALARWPQLPIATSAESLIRRPGLHGLYIATPPAAHMPLSEQAFDAGLAVFCEKPLTTDFDAGLAAIERIKVTGQRAAVNFALASSAGLALLQTTFGAASHMPMGALREVELELAFSAWPRPWQADAGAWLSERREGGFTREVLSHFIFVLQRVLGPAKVQARRVSYPDDGRGAETLLRAELLAGGVPVRISGRVEPSVEMPDRNRMLWRTAEGEIELRQWFTEIEQRRSDSLQPQLPPDPVALRVAAQADQLQQWAAMIDGQSHSLPGYAESLSVQQTIEDLLKE
jgi:predicted dehydrogenase